MKHRYSLFLLALLVLIYGSSYTVSYSLFASSAHNNGNTFSSGYYVTPSPTSPVPNLGDVVINEINWSGSNGDGLDEWVELRNTTGSSINVSGWVIENLGTGSSGGANITIPSGKTISANGYFLISAKDKTTSKINVDPDYVNSAVSLNNGGEQLVLRSSASGTIIDTANGTGSWFAGTNPTPKKTMERKTPSGDGTVSTNWQTATTHIGMDASGPSDEFGTPKNPNP